MNAHDEEEQELAEDFQVSQRIMREFLNRFSPRRTTPRQFASRSDVVLYVHIPKTAGMSVGKSLAAAFKHFRPVSWNDVSGSFRQHMRLALFEQTKGETRQVIIGHFGWQELQLYRNHGLVPKCATIFREPISRAVSNYYYNLSETHPNNTAFSEKYPTLLSYIRALPLDMQLSQAIGYIDSFEAALVKLTEYYSFLGVTEHLGRSLEHFSKTHALAELSEHHINVGKISAETSITDDIAKYILERSYNDLKLHRLLMRIYSDH